MGWSAARIMARRRRRLRHHHRRFNNPVLKPNPSRPTVTAMAPHVGSTRGGAWATITGVDFQPGAKVRLGDPRYRLERDSTTIAIWTAAHSAGTVDVIVTNPSGLSTRLTGAYTFAPPESFDFNGEWVAHAGSEYETDMRFTIRNDIACQRLMRRVRRNRLASASRPQRRLLFLGDDGLAISGTQVSPINAVGTINVPACPAARMVG